MVRVEDGFGTDLVARPDGSLVPPPPPTRPADSATTRSKSARVVMVRIACLKVLAGPKRLAYQGATLRKRRDPRSSP